MTKNKMKTNGNYGEIKQHENGVYSLYLFEIWEGIKFNLGGTTCATAEEAKFYANGHGIPYNNLSLI